MAYDVVKQKFPGAPTAVGARVRHAGTGREGSIVPPVAGQDGVRVRFDGAAFAKACDPRSITYLDTPEPAAPWVMR